MEKEYLFEQFKKSQMCAEKERRRKHGETALTALEKWNSFSHSGTSPYLEKKQVNPFGVRFKNDFLVIPMKDTAGKLWSLQWIASNGAKRFLSGGRKKGCFHSIGTLENGKPIILTEGYATGASVHMATQQPTVVAFDAGNLEPVIEELRVSYSSSPLLIAGDDDYWESAVNIGREKAEYAALKYHCSLVFPQFKETQTQPTDFNDLHVLEGLDTVKTQIEQVLLKGSVFSKVETCPKTEETPESLSEPLPVENTLLPVLPFTLDMIPEPLQPWVRDIT